MSLRTLLLAPLAFAAMTGVACSDSAEPTASPDDDAIAATLTDGRIELSASSAPAGRVSFAIANDGSAVHEFEVLRTDIAADALPVDSGVAQTSADGVEIVDEVEEIAPGTSAELAVELDTGAYVIICNVAGHYDAGMAAAFAVE